MSFPRYRSYKDSGVEWLGQVPAHWPIDRLKWSTIDCRNGIWGDEPRADENDIICVRVADFDRVRLTANLEEPTIRNVSEKERAGRLLGLGDLLLEKSGGGELQPVGCVVLFDAPNPAVCSNFVARVRLSLGQDASYWRYVHAAAYSARLNTKSIKQTSGIQNLDSQRYLDEMVPFPPFVEQRAIAAFLDRETSKIDALVAEQERLIELLKEKRQAVISHAVTKGLNPDAPMKDSGIEWLGQVPAHWEVVPLQVLTQQARPIMYGIVLPGPDVEDGVPILKGGNVKPHRMNLESMAQTTREIEAPYARARLKAGDLVYSIRGSIGDCEIVPSQLEGSNITQDVARVAIREPYDSRWARWVLLSSAIREELASGSLGAAVRGINIFDLKRVRVPKPPPSEQRQIGLFVSERVGEFESLIEQTQRALDLLRERRSALISAAVTGQIDVRPESLRSAA